MKKTRFNFIATKYFWYVFITLIAVFFRFAQLDKVPAGLVSDELDYVINAKSIFLTGRDIQDTWTPASLTPIPQEYPKAELPYFVSLPFVGPFSFSLFHAKAGYAILSVVLVWAIASLAESFFGFKVGVIAGIVAAINPWSIYFGRTAYDVPVAVTMYILGCAILFKYQVRGIFLAVTIWLVAFYSYIGMKLLFIPVVCSSLLLSYLLYKRRNYRLWYIVAGISVFIFFGYYVLNIKSSGASERLNQLFTPYSQEVVSSVDTQRRLVLENPFTSIISNKYVVYIKELSSKFYGAFNPNLLFISGEGIATFSLWEHGLFYPIEAVFLIVGLIAICVRHRLKGVWTISMIAISTMPSLLSTVGVSYVHRSSLMYPLFMIAIAYGIWTLYEYVAIKRKQIFLIGIIILYGLAILNFSYTYFYRFPYYNSEAFGLSARVYTRFIHFAEEKNIPVVFLAESTVGDYRNYLFYDDAINKTSLPLIQKSLREKNYQIHNVLFTSVCPTKEEVLSKQAIYIFNESSSCKELFIGMDTNIIPALADGGTLYRIFNDEVCEAYELSPYPKDFRLSDFGLEKLSKDLFCKKFIIRYTNPKYLPTIKK